ncbi:hydrogenase, partial [Halarcobacter bivalviorum]
NILFERDVLVESKRLMSYFFGRKLYAKYINALKKSTDIKDIKKTKEVINIYSSEEEDSRYEECMK